MSDPAASNESVPRRALFSVSRTEGLAALASELVRLGWELWATEGTGRHLQEAGVPVRPLSELTGQVSMLGGRVKTLHPRVFGGVLARPSPQDLAELEQAGGVPFDLVVVNFYPFEERLERYRSGELTLAELVESMDIGGPALARAAAKNFARVAVLTDPSQYAAVLDEIRHSPHGLPADATRVRLAAEAVRRTARYDAVIAQALQQEAGPPAAAPQRVEVSFPERLTLEATRWLVARYGENPHQAGAVYRVPVQGASVPWGKVLQGKELSYNNVADAAAALDLVAELSDRPAAVAIKHATPCGAAVADSLLQAYQLAHDADPVSVFGGVVAVSRPVDGMVAEAMARTFLEVIVAPSFEPEALEVLSKKPRLRLIEVGPIEPPWRRDGDGSALEVRSVFGGLLVQQVDAVDWVDGELRTVTRQSVPERLWPDLRFAWRVVKYARSNAIVVARDGQTLGIGAGQTSRIDAARIAIEKAGERASGAVLASDGFFPFSDVVELAAEHGIAAIVQPGGSMRDQESITAADRAGLAMVFTGIRHFRH
ncbi:MAG: bifunctional phosphoribosylaminoimidazolecarboxamide formyltransferase/IMP cyclohydrolase [Limnochordaceae bacterium]|nr:bifunctional phosphoribosylaminoimidazolecarboxamide formyltransferase/IMP cyclohydrolase [Limnochordaceae bacterium]